MEPTGRDQHWHTDDHHYKSRNYRPLDRPKNTHDRRSEAAPESGRREDGARDNRKPKKPKPAPKKDKAPKSFGTLVLAAGLGIVAGFLLSQGRRKSKPRRRADGPSDGRRARSVGEGGEDWGDWRRLDYRRSSDRLAVTGPGVRGRSTSRSTRYAPVGELEWDYWR